MKFELKYKAGGVRSSHAQYKRIAKMAKGYSLLIYHKGEYPDGTAIGDVSKKLEETGVSTKNGEKKKWPYTKAVRSKYSKKIWRTDVKSICEKILWGEYSRYLQGYQALGRLICRQLMHQIWATVAPPLAKKTIEKKGHPKPLIETRRLVNSIKYKVINNASIKGGNE